MTTSDAAVLTDYAAARDTDQRSGCNGGCDLASLLGAHL
jgi:hypothetical protein